MLRIGVLLLGIGLGCLVAASTAGAAKGSASLQKGVASFAQFAFGDAARHFRAALKQGLTSPERAQALAYLAVCHYNMARLKRADATFVKALGISSTVALPKGQAPALYRHFGELRRKWLERQAPRRAPVVRPRPRAPSRPKAPPRRRVVPRLRPQVRPVQPVRPRPVARPIKRRLTKRPSPRVARVPVVGAGGCPVGHVRRAPGLFARHGVSFVLLGVGVVVALGGVISGAIYQGDHTTLRFLEQEPGHDAATIMAAYDSAWRAGLTSTILLASGGVLAGAAISAFVVEAVRPLPPGACVLKGTSSK